MVLFAVVVFVGLHAVQEISASITINKPGFCPPPNFVNCVVQCSSDASCPKDDKCCSTGCGYTCQFPDSGVCPTFGPCPEIAQVGCRRAQFVIGTDNQTSCRICDTTICGPTNAVCPLVSCPEVDIRPFCTKYTFTIGMDGITKCRGCPSDMCGDISLVCPSIECPNDIPSGCAVPQFIIGTDNITRCRVCDKNGCIPSGTR